MIARTILKRRNFQNKTHCFYYFHLIFHRKGELAEQFLIPSPLSQLNNKYEQIALFDAVMCRIGSHRKHF